MRVNSNSQLRSDRLFLVAVVEEVRTNDPLGFHLVTPEGLNLPAAQYMTQPCASFVTLGRINNTAPVLLLPDFSLAAFRDSGSIPRGAGWVSSANNNETIPARAARPPNTLDRQRGKGGGGSPLSPAHCPSQHRGGAVGCA